jgi:hypothetical protein
MYDQARETAANWASEIQKGNAGGVMKGRQKVGFGIYLLVTIFSISWGFLYFFSHEMMPYHKQVIGKNWGEIERGIQVIILALMESVGAACLTIGFTVLILLFIPFRRGEIWANWTIFLGGIVFSGLAFFITFKVHLATNASTPCYLFLLTTVLILTGFLFSLGMEKGKIES